MSPDGPRVTPVWFGLRKAFCGHLYHRYRELQARMNTPQWGVVAGDNVIRDFFTEIAQGKDVKTVAKGAGASSIPR